MSRRALAALALAACHKTTAPAPEGMPPNARCVASCDLATEDGVRAMMRDLGKPLEKQACIERGLDNRIAMLGDFAYDRGCAWNEVVIGCCAMPIGDDQTMLRALGWASATPAARAKLVPEYLGAFHGVRGATSAKPAYGADGHPAFSAPSTTTAADGSIVYTAWFESTDSDGGMTAPTENRFQQRAYTFSPSGTMTQQQLAAFTTPWAPQH